MNIGNEVANMSEILKLQLQVAEIAEENKKKVAALQAKFEKVEKEAYDECPVCYGSISVKNTCCMPNCDHKMCKNCYYNWLDQQEKNTCPMCRAEVFKNNDEIITKRETLQHQVNDLIGNIQNLNWDRRELRKSMTAMLKEQQEMRDSVMWLEDKYEQLDNEIFDKQQIVDEIREYERHHDIWKKKRKHRLARQIRIGREKWKSNIKNVHKELLKEGLKEELDPYCDEVDISEVNMFDEPGDLLDNIDNCCLENRIGKRDPRSEHKYKLEDSLYRIQKYKLYKSAYNYGWRIPTEEVNVYEEDGYETDDTMPSLIEATDQELENMALEGTEIEEGEIIEPPPINRVSRRLNFDVIAINEDRSTGEVTSRNISIRI
jgi:hypothetical protein